MKVVFFDGVLVAGTITGAIRLLCVLNAAGNDTAPEVMRSFLTIIYGDMSGRGGVNVSDNPE